MLSLRYKSNDHLWFAFFHEAGHLLFHGKKMMFLETVGGMSDDNEEEADAFARNFLIALSTPNSCHTWHTLTTMS